MRVVESVYGVALLIASFYVASSDLAQQFGLWGIVPAILGIAVLHYKPALTWRLVGLSGLFIGFAAFSGYASFATRGAW